MNCNEKLLQMYIDDSVDEPVAMLLIEHLKSCSSCRRELTQLKALDWDLRNRPKVVVPNELAGLRRATLDACFEAVASEEKASFSASNLVYLQASIWKGCTAFLGCLPRSSLLMAGVRKKSEPAQKQSALRSVLKRVIGF